MNNSIVLTGVTGFLGKVVLEELVRRGRSLNIDKITILIRPVASRPASERFSKEVAQSPCFSRLAKSWARHIEVISCDLSRASCGISPAQYAQICKQTTHIIHCAGSVAFSSAKEKMILDNIISALNILEMAQDCSNLRRLVTTSTAFVSLPSPDPIYESLIPLPDSMSAQELFNLLQGGELDLAQILQMTGHPNLYTLSKCLAEHLLIERKGSISLVIIRPSIISASIQFPFPGWIDSFAALAGLVASCGSGVLRVLKADPKVVMDVVPVDIVTGRLIDEALSRQEKETIKVVHVVSTVENGLRIAKTRSAVLDYFSAEKGFRKASVRLVRSNHVYLYHLYDLLYQRMPQGLAKLLAGLRGDTKDLRRIERARKVQRQVNELFEVFTHNTYDFRCRYRSLGQDFSPDAYLSRICQGVREHLLQQRRL